MTRSREWRRDKDKNIIKKRKTLLKHIDPSRVECFKDNENRLAVKHPLDCGKADCGVCSAHKRSGCSSKNKDEHVLLEIQIQKETQQELTNEMCDFGD